MKSALLAWSVLAMLAGGCGRRAPAVDSSPDPDSLRAAQDAARMLQTAKPELEWWARRWSRFVPRFTLDSLRLVELRPTAVDPIALPAEMWATDLDRRLFGEPSPDSSLVVYPDVYRSYDPGQDGIEYTPSPDTWTLLVDTRRDSAWTLDRCGTPCANENAVWITPRMVALMRTVESDTSPESGFGQLLLFDLDRRTVAIFRTPSTAKLAEARIAARAEMDAGYRQRLGELRGRRAGPPA